MKNVLTNLTQVDIEVASVLAGRTFLTGIDERIEHPELDIFDVGRFKIAVIQLPHHATPLLFGIVKQPLCRQIRVEVVRSTLAWIVRKVQDWESSRGSTIATLVALGVQLPDIHLANVMIGQLFQVALDMLWRQRTAATGEQWVDGIPSQERPIVATAQGCLITILGKHRRHTRHNP